MSKNYFTLQLSVDALETLFKDTGEEFVVKIRQAAIEEFCKRRIKAVTPETLKAALEGILEEEIKEQIGTVTRSWNEIKLKLNPSIDESLRVKAREIVGQTIIEVKDEVAKETNVKMEKMYKLLLSEIDSRIQYFLNQKVERYITDEVERRLKAALNIIK